MLVGHSARIVYEGSLALKSPDPAVGVPSIASALSAEHGEVVARARHAGKLLDDTKKSYQALQQDMAAFYAAQRAEFTAHVPWWLRWLADDLGICRGPGDVILFSTIAGQFRLGVPPEVRLEDAGPLMFDVARELGESLSLFLDADGAGSGAGSTVDYGPLGGFRDDDQKAVRYLAERYDPAFDLETKLLLLMVEGELGVSHVLLPITQSGHEEAVFRARMVSTFHAARAIEEILGRHTAADSKGARRARNLLADPELRAWLSDPGIRQVRNRCMHYEIRDRSLRVDSSARMFGIVEALTQGQSFERLEQETRTVEARLLEVLREW
jgi:hypothetical protein